VPELHGGGQRPSPVAAADGDGTKGRATMVAASSSTLMAKDRGWMLWQSNQPSRICACIHARAQASSERRVPRLAGAVRSCPSLGCAAQLARIWSAMWDGVSGSGL
jgi:hypothetical protein